MSKCTTQLRFEANLPSYIDNTKPLTEQEYRQALADPDNKLHLPLLEVGEEYPTLVERENVIRPDTDIFEASFEDFMELQIIRERNDWDGLIEIANKWSLYGEVSYESLVIADDGTKGILGQYKEDYLQGFAENDTLNGFAHSVRMRDLPKYFDSILTWVRAQEGVILKEEFKTAGDTFLDHEPSVFETVGKYLKQYLKVIFWDKYTHFGIRCNEHIMNNLKRNPERYCAYPFDFHPEEKFGHFALFAAIGDGIRHHYDLPQEVNQKLYEGEYMATFKRILAGVHFPSSIQGHNEVLGRKITY